ncbi:hypothetical protein, partial [Ruminococcus callidus]|uniref:hypothetical protein n=1 Tax=Ruminococcus callidus TaxID=40519 RepID=UPI0023F908E1
QQVFTPLFVSSDEKFDDASVAQSLCDIALTEYAGMLLHMHSTGTRLPHNAFHFHHTAYF